MIGEPSGAAAGVAVESGVGVAYHVTVVLEDEGLAPVGAARSARLDQEGGSQRLELNEIERTRTTAAECIQSKRLHLELVC